MHIRELELLGGTQKERRMVRERFGDIKLIPINRSPKQALTLRIQQILPNFYRLSSATKSLAPLFILVPNVEIGEVWPDNIENYNDIRLGIARYPYGHGTIVRGMAFHSGIEGIYICLQPLPPRHPRLKVGSLGI